MGITILKWIVFIAICVLDFIGYVMEKFNDEEHKSIANVVGIICGMMARLYILYILYTRWLMV